MTKLENIKRLPSAGMSEAITLASLNEANCNLQKTVEDLALAIRPIALALKSLEPTLTAMSTQIEQIEQRTRAIEQRLASTKR